jgi:hypothetical protein
MKISDPRSWLWAGERRLIVDAGRVGCPIRGDVDQEECFACGRMLRYADGEQPVVVCGQPFGDSMLQLVDRGGW